MTITLPTRIEDALNKKAAEFELGGPDYLKNLLFTAAHAKEGVVLKLDLAPAAPDPNQAELPLVGGAAS
jgi:hypothetical protein